MVGGAVFLQGFQTIYAAPGLFFGQIGQVRVVFLGGLISNADFQKFLSLLASDIDERPDTQQMGVLYHIPDLGANPERRHAIAMTLREREAKLGKITAAYVMVTTSFIVRGVLKAIWWIAPPPYPCQVVATPNEGFTYLARHLPQEDPELLSSTYAALHSTHPWLTNSQMSQPA